MLLTRGLPDPAALVPLIASAIGLVLILAGGKLLPSRRALAATWLMLTALELIWVDSALLTSRPLDEFTDEPAASTLLAGKPGSIRLFSPTYSVSALQAAIYGYQLAEGVSPLQLRSYQEYLTQSLGIRDEGYSVTLPPVTWVDQVSDHASNVDLARLEKLNIGWFISSSPLEVDGLVLEEGESGEYAYRLAQPRPRAWLEMDQGESGSGWEPVAIESWSPNRLRIQVSGPGRLVLSEVYYPGWSVAVDGRRDSIQLEDGLFRAVTLTPGSHGVVFTFNPWTVYVGWGATFLTCVLMLISLRRR